MEKEKYEAELCLRRRQFVDWLFWKIELDLRIKPSMFARAIGIDIRTLNNLKRGAATMRHRWWRMWLGTLVWQEYGNRGF